MIPAHHLGRPLAILAAALILVTPRDASAVVLDAVILPIHQVGTTAGVSLGHAAIGTTNYNKITVSGAYTAACASPVMAPTGGQGSLSRQELLGGISLTVTVPQRVPAIVDMPGFDLLAAGSRVSCTYNWSAKAVESSYTFGIPGFSTPVGGGERAQGGTYPFTMVVPAAEEQDDEGCA